MNNDLDILQMLYNNCDPDQPADLPFYLDCSTSRGNVGELDRTVRELNFARQPLHLLFTGHSGCGKSSELLALRRKLEDQKTPDGRHRYFIVRFKALEYLNTYDVYTWDILWAVMAEFVSQVYDRTGVRLEDAYLERRWKDIRKFFVSDMELAQTEISLPGVKTRLQFKSGDKKTLDELRLSDRPKINTILLEINSLFDKTRVALRERGFDDILLILDDLEKIERFEEFSQGADSHRELFIERKAIFTGLKAHLIITIPLPLARSCGPQLYNLYQKHPLILPMIKVTERDGLTPYEAGCGHLRGIIERRLYGRSVTETFTEEALSYLFHYSGGHIRQMLRLIQDACLNANALPVVGADVLQALNSVRAIYDGAMREDWVVRLAELQRDPNRYFDISLPDSPEMLEQNMVMEYVNGDKHISGGVQALPWYAVHPAARELPRFKACLERLKIASNANPPQIADATPQLEQAKGMNIPLKSQPD